MPETADLYTIIDSRGQNIAVKVEDNSDGSTTITGADKPLKGDYSMSSGGVVTPDLQVLLDYCQDLKGLDHRLGVLPCLDFTDHIGVRWRVSAYRMNDVRLAVNRNARDAQGNSWSYINPDWYWIEYSDTQLLVSDAVLRWVHSLSPRCLASVEDYLREIATSRVA